MQNIKDNGNKTSNMVMENKHGQMKQSIKDNINTVKNMVKVNLCGKMIVVIKVISTKTILME